MKRYPAYKDSGVPWVGEVPAHWEVKRNKLFLREVNERSADGSEELLTVSQYTGVTRRRERLSQEEELLTNAASLVGYKQVSPGDLVMNIMLAWNGSLGVSPIAGIASPAYCVFRVGCGVQPRFLHYLLRTPLFTGAFKTVSTGVVDSRLRLYPDVFFRLPSLLPPECEQAAIVRFLDRIDRRIRRYIRAKQKLIKMLEEQKQAIIHRAVTLGLDPNVRLKPSGIDWLCDIPEHWEVRQLKQLLVRMDYGTSESLGAEGPIRVLTMGHIQDGRVIPPEIGSLHSIPPELVLARNDLLFNRTNSPELVGKVGIFRGTSEDRVSFASYLVRLRTSSEHDPEWLDYLLNSTSFWGYARSMALVSLHQANLNSTRYGQMLLPVPPVPEQRAVAQYLNEQSGRIAGSIDAERQAIDFIREYRTRLTYDVVTGKVDVRELAAGLPEVEEAETQDDVPAEVEAATDEDPELAEEEAGADD